jgi:hypothetical protein
MKFTIIDKIHFFPFLLSFGVGIFFVYILKPAPIIIMKYPNLENAGKLIYRDRNGTCFVYEANEVDCDKNEARIKAFPLF